MLTYIVGLYIEVKLFLITKSREMNRHHARNDSFHGSVDQELTLQDIRLRRQILENTSKPNISRGDSMNDSMVDMTSQSPSQVALDQHSYTFKSMRKRKEQSWLGNNQSFLSLKPKNSKINSAAYHDQLQGHKSAKTIQTKKKLSVSLSQQYNKQIETINNAFSLKTKEQAKAQTEINKTNVNISAGKQNEVSQKVSQSMMLKIQEPKLVWTSTAQEYKKYSGRCLSKIIMQRALQAKQR